MVLAGSYWAVFRFGLWRTLYCFDVKSTNPEQYQDKAIIYAFLFQDGLTDRVSLDSYSQFAVTNPGEMIVE